MSASPAVGGALGLLEASRALVSDSPRFSAFSEPRDRFGVLRGARIVVTQAFLCGSPSSFGRAVPRRGKNTLCMHPRSWGLWSPRTKQAYYDYIMARTGRRDCRHAPSPSRCAARVLTHSDLHPQGRRAQAQRGCAETRCSDQGDQEGSKGKRCRRGGTGRRRSSRLHCRRRAARLTGGG